MASLVGLLRRQLNETSVTMLTPRSIEVDLRNASETIDYFMAHQPTIVVHCAVQGGGIGWMKAHPVESGQDNFRININVLEAAHKAGTDRFVGVSSACIYPSFALYPFMKRASGVVFPEPTNAAYALSKRAMMELGRAYAQQYGMHSRTFQSWPISMGPGDHLDSERAHVVADLMISLQSDPNELVVWGTGTPTREFLYIDDAAQGVLACLDAPSGHFVNIGTESKHPSKILLKR